MNIIINNSSSSNISASQDDNGNVIINVSDKKPSIVKQIAEDIKDPRSEISKSIQRVFAPKRR